MLTDEILNAFKTDGEYKNHEPVGNGLINTTYRAVYGGNSYVIQRINNSVFKDVDALMSNICGVTEFLHKKIEDNGGDPLRETLNVVPTVDGKPYYKCSDGFYWRCYLFIDDAFSYDSAESPEDMYSCALAFSRFQQLLSDYPAEKLFETIRDFHNTPDRCAQLMKAVRSDAFNRLADVRSQVSFVIDRASEISYFTDRLASGELPYRITHNDTKLNNVMFDNATGKALCVIDLDTVMPGAVAYDFGDAIRSGAPTESEETLTPENVRIDLDRFEMFTKGFLEGCGDCLTDGEINSLVWGVKLMTLECGIRFLTDYLNGDVYFRTTRVGQNLSRAKSQFALVSDIENKWYDLISIVSKYSKK